ncbi:MAG: glutamate--tRNA ligase, partial [Actinomycetes bacterium]
DLDELAERLLPYLVTADLVSDPPTPGQRALVRAVAPLVQERINTLAEAVDLLRFLFVADSDLAVEDNAGLAGEPAPVLAAAAAALEPLDPFDAPTIETALRTALITDLGLKPKLAFGPVRAAVTGRKISPPLFESLELLGKQSTLARIAAAQDGLAG